MNEDQAAHAKLMAIKIEQYAAAMVRRMQAMQNAELSRVSVEAANRSFDDLEMFWREIQTIRRDMQPDLK
jgi:hypothetical protein